MRLFKIVAATIKLMIKVSTRVKTLIITKPTGCVVTMELEKSERASPTCVRVCIHNGVCEQVHILNKFLFFQVNELG